MTATLTIQRSAPDTSCATQEVAGMAETADVTVVTGAADRAEAPLDEMPDPAPDPAGQGGAEQEEDELISWFG
jgi:hypothetical protein